MFTGKPYIGELGYAFLFRNYRPEQGKWQTADPLGYPDGWNNLAYVNNGVTEFFDSHGLCTDLGLFYIRCDVKSQATRTLAGAETIYCQLTCGCSSGAPAEYKGGLSISLGIVGNISLWGISIPVNISFKWTSPQHSIPEYVCSSPTHTANGGMKSVVFYTTPHVQYDVMQYECGLTSYTVSNQWTETGNRTVILSNCE
jgi:RHS repeat-associated protein